MTSKPMNIWHNSWWITRECITKLVTNPPLNDYHLLFFKINQHLQNLEQIYKYSRLREWWQASSNLSHLDSHFTFCSLLNILHCHFRKLKFWLDERYLLIIFLVQQIAWIEIFYTCLFKYIFSKILK